MTRLTKWQIYDRIYTMFRDIATPFQPLRLKNYTIQFEWSTIRVLAPRIGPLKKMSRPEHIEILEELCAVYLRIARGTTK